MGALDWLKEIVGGGAMPSMNAMGDAGGMGGAMPQPPTPQMAVDPMNAGGQPSVPIRPPTNPNQPFINATNGYNGAGGAAEIGVPPMPPGDPMAGMGSGPGPGLPPTPPLPPGGDPMAGMGSGPGPGLPASMPVPQQRAPNLPPPAAATPPNPPTDISAAARMRPPEPNSGPQARSIIGRALGLDANGESSMRGSLGAGLKAAGENANKPGLAAFAGSMGSGIEGGKAADDKTLDQQDRFLGRSIASKTAANAGLSGESTRDLNVARTKLALAQAQAAMTGKGGKESVVNSEQQLYLRAQSAAAQDGRLKALKTQADQAATAFGPDSPQAKAAIKAHKEAYDATVEGHAKALGIDPGKIGKIGKQPGMSSENPVPKAGLTKEKFDALPPGSYFVNPKDGKVLVKKGAEASAAGANPPASPQQSMTPSVPPTPPTPVTAPAGSQADDEE